MGYALWISEKKPPVTVICGDPPSPKPLQARKIKTVCLRKSSIHPPVIWWTECILVTTAWHWVTSTKLQQLLILGVAEKGRRRRDETFPMLEECQEGDIPTPWHSQLCVNCSRDLKSPKERPRELPPPICKLTAHPNGCSRSGAPGPSYTSLSPLETRGCPPDLPQGWTQPAVGRQRGERAQSHRPRSSKVIRQTHYGNNYSLLSLGNKALRYCITFLLKTPWYLFSVAQCILYLHESLVLNSITK